MSVCNTNNSRGCGCPSNEGSCVTDCSKNGSGLLSSLQSCETHRPCWAGWNSYERTNGGGTPGVNKQCACQLINYDEATEANRADCFNSSTDVAYNKLECCVGKRSGPCQCAPGWCPRSVSVDCDSAIGDYLQGQGYNITDPVAQAGIQTYCSVVPRGSAMARRDDPAHPCHTYTQQYCTTGNNIMNPYCRESIAVNRVGNVRAGYPPGWADVFVPDFCHNNRRAPDPIRTFCACVNSTLVESECTDPACTNRSGYRTSSQIDGQQHCPTICQQIIAGNKAGGNINIDNNTFIQQCGQYTNNTGLVTHYNIVNGRCVPQDNGPYLDDKTCGGHTAAGGGIPWWFYLVIGGGLLLAILFIIVVIFRSRRK